jgi:hypothetical protein
MEGGTFNNYFTRHFIRIIHLERRGMLIYDGHSFHFSVSLVEKARNENTVILKLQTNTSYVTDFIVFWQLKLKWDEEIIKWQRKIIQRSTPQSKFSSTIPTFWKNIDLNNTQNGFKSRNFHSCDTIASKSNKWRWPGFKQSQEAATLSSMSRAEEAATSQPLRSDVETVSQLSMREIPIIQHLKNCK